MAHKTHIFAAPEPAFLVNSFLLEDAEHVVIIDAQFLVSSAGALRARLDEIGKPLAALILSHPHPDHYNGAAILLDGLGEVPILSTFATNQGIRATAEAKRAFWTPRYSEDYPQTFVYPNRVIVSGERLQFGDIILTVNDLGPGEASDIVVFHAPETDELFASDLIYSACHPWLAEERADLWRAQLAVAKTRYSGVKTVHAGHGPSGGIGLIDTQKDYISIFEGLVRTHGRSKGLADQDKAAIHRDAVERYPGYPLEFLIDLNAEAMAATLFPPTVT